ncbi:MAG: hypothetical protein R3E50_12250 [Halioglobus sp.]
MLTTDSCPATLFRVTAAFALSDAFSSEVSRTGALRTHAFVRHILVLLLHFASFLFPTRSTHTLPVFTLLLGSKLLLQAGVNRLLLRCGVDRYGRN